jgi:hypothetical protein
MRHQAFLKWISQLKRLSTSTNPISMSGSLYDQWSKVASCEEGGWVGSSGSAYPDSLGINATNWYANGGGSDVSPAAQIVVAERLIHRYGIGIPDQYACAAW